MGVLTRKLSPKYAHALDLLLAYRIRNWTWWLIDKVDGYRPKGRGSDSRFSSYVGTLDKSFTRSCLRRFGVKFRHSIRAESGAPLSSRRLEEAL